ncbi:MAG TPA: tRNA lysidine(34) synthetase TilS [Clostridiales bacterium]|nr:tRNA lysidine(34) synthetase TilS [Clostridiales bacterium]
MNKNISSKIITTIEEYSMLHTDDCVVVGVSGGADSMCLLHFLCSVRDKYNLHIVAAHVNHNLRGDEALRDEAFVAGWCSEHKIEFRLLSVDINRLSQEQNMGTEECGRNCRYEFFQTLANECNGNSKIATAHTLSDTTETVLFNITRGSGLQGLCGIPPVRDNIVRPLIGITRAQVEYYCSINNVSFINDSSNLTDDYSRNKIRHNVIPVLKAVNPSVEASFGRLTHIVIQQQQFITEVAMTALTAARCDSGYSSSVLVKLNPVVLSQCLIMVANNSGCKGVQEKHIDLMKGVLTTTSGAVDLPGGYVAYGKQGVFRVAKAVKNKENYVFPLDISKEFIICDKILSFKLISTDELNKNSKINKKLLKNLLDYDIIKNNTIIRNRSNGDVFSPYGRGVTKSLKKLFNEGKIPVENRDKLLIISCGDTIIWVEGFGVSQQYGITEKTKNVLCINVSEVSDFS